MTSQLSKDLQDKLTKLGSTVELSKTIDGVVPTQYAFITGDGRTFSTIIASPTKFSILLHERTPALKYEFCFGRGLINSLDSVAKIVDLWVDKKKDISEIMKLFPEIEVFKPFEFQHPNTDIEAAWTKVKNLKFSDEKFYEDPDWNARHETMLVAAKKHVAFKNYFPLLSHYNLRFSIDKDMKESWPFYYSIVPSPDKSKGEYLVEISMEFKDGKYFPDIKSALDFYADFLSKIPATKWAHG
jgi:hypothetical protein